ncbi:unnamed protein product [Caenorhabditis sp. 36 PRJEB53466]|nr:unnamed protein product [Caenorhabditis sp. 36 PRJEB53466]
MSGFFSKLFPGNSSSSTSNNTDLGSMESLCVAINELCRENADHVGEKAADLVRKNKDLFEKKPSDVEAFLLHCSPHVGSAAMVAAIKGMFDASAAKNNETGMDRAVELLNHYYVAEESSFVGEHLKYVPEIIFPLLRSIGIYCWEKKNKPEIGQRIILKALNSMYPRGEYCSRVLTSAHSVLFSCALKTKNYAEVEPFIDVHIDEVANEKCVADQATEDPNALMSKFSKKGHLGNLSTLLQPVPFLNPKFVLEYLYNGACILIELKRYEDAFLLLENCVSIPAHSVQDQHVDGYKKFVLLSLLLNGKVIDFPEKQVGARNSKSKTNEYKIFAEVKFSRSGNTPAKLEELIGTLKERLKNDGNLELANLVVNEMRKKTILSLTKMFASIRLTDIAQLAHIASPTETNTLIKELVAEQRITVREEDGFVFWEALKPLPTKTDVEHKIKTVNHLNDLLIAKNQALKTNRLKTAIFNEDEGLSMPAHDQ